jgi:hypothetical protein
MQTAKRLIAKFGANIELVVFVDQLAEVARPWRIESIGTMSQTVKGVWLTSRKNKDGGAADYRQPDFNELLPTKEKRLLIAAQGLTATPNIQAQIRESAESIWTIVSIQEVAPDGNAIIYILQVRQ